MDNKQSGKQVQNKSRRRPVITFRMTLLMLLIASIIAFLGQIFFNAVSHYGYFGQQEVRQADMSLQQTKLKLRVDELEQMREEQRAVLERQLDKLSKLKGDDLSLAYDNKYNSPFSIEDVMGSIVEIVCLDNEDKDIFYTGSGTIVDESGLVLTNRHLLVSKDSSLIQFCGVGFTTNIEQPPNIDYIAEATAIREKNDLAILEIAEHIDGKKLPDDFQSIEFDGCTLAADSLRLGDDIYIAGYPGIGAETFTFTTGVVSGRVGKNLIKTSALIDSGTSGGAAFDSQGNYVGLPTAAARGDIGGSLGYLISADVIDEFLKNYYAGKLNDSVSFVE